MAITVVGSAGVDGLSVSLPAGTTTDDVVIGSIANNTLDGTSVTNSWSTSGYDANVQFDLNNTEFDNVNLKVAYKVQGGTPDSTMVINTPSPAYDRTILAYVFRGVDTTTPLDVTTQTALGGLNDNSPDPPSITPNTDGAAIYIVGATTDDITTAAPTNYSNYDEALHSEGGTDDIGHYVASRILATAALENPGIFDAGGGSSSTWIAATMALKPAGGGGGPTAAARDTLHAISRGWVGLGDSLHPIEEGL